MGTGLWIGSMTVTMVRRTRAGLEYNIMIGSQH